MLIRAVIFAAASVAVSSMSAQASTIPSFSLDQDASSISVEYDNFCDSNFVNCVTIDGGFSDFSWTPGAQNDTTYAGNLMNWQMSGLGLRNFNIAASLGFTVQHDAATTSVAFDFIGTMADGVLSWGGPAGMFLDGHYLELSFDDVDFGAPDATSPLLSGAALTFLWGAADAAEVPLAQDDSDSEQIAAVVPLPASVPMLMVGLASLGLIGRRKRRG